MESDSSEGSKSSDALHPRLCVVNKSGYDVKITAPLETTVCNNCSCVFDRVYSQITFEKNNRINLKNIAGLDQYKDIIVTINSFSYFRGCNIDISSVEKHKVDDLLGFYLNLKKILRYGRFSQRSQSIKPMILYWNMCRKLILETRKSYRDMFWDWEKIIQRMH